MYWDINRALSYNCLFNFIVGARGVGKTYGCKNWAIKDFLKTGGQFVYVRRFKTELKKTDKFFDDIIDSYPSVDFYAKNGRFRINEQDCGVAVPLSTGKVEKSVPFPNVNKIIFDEFILDKGYHHYLPDEVTNFLELYSTIARMRDVKVFFLSNALTITNPYFIYFNLRLPYGKNDIIAKNDILLQNIKASEFEKRMQETRFAKIISGTPYADYAIHNDFLRDDSTFIQKKTPNSTYLFTMVYKGEKYGVWIDYKEGLEFVSHDIDPSCLLVYSLTMADHSPNTLLLKGQKSSLIESFIKNYKLGVVRFENVNVKNICNDIIKMTL